MADINPPGHAETFTRPPLVYPGNKAELADLILANTPSHETYVEPFCGSAAVLFNKKPSRNEVINDLNTSITTFMRVLRDEPEPLVSYLRQTPYAETEYQRVKDRWETGWRPDDDIKHAGQLFFLRRASFGGALGGFRATAIGRKNSARTFSNARERLYDLSERLDGVIIRNTDWRTCIETYASPGTFFYLDPPYAGRKQYYDVSFHRQDFEDYWLAQFDGAPNAYNADLYAGETPPEFLEQEPYTSLNDSPDEPEYGYGTSNPPFQVMISAEGGIDALDPYTWCIRTDGSHEVNNQSGAQAIEETLHCNYDPFSDDFTPFAGPQASLEAF